MTDLDAGTPTDRRAENWLHVDRGRISMAGQPVSPDTALASYAAVLSAVRGATLGEPLPLRSEDLAVLAAALGTDDSDVETRIRALLGCSPTEARRVHRELVRRRLLRPVAALAAGSLLVWGPAAAARSDRPKLLPTPSTTAPDASATTTSAPIRLAPGPAVADNPNATTPNAPSPNAPSPDPARPGPATRGGDDPTADRMVPVSDGDVLPGEALATTAATSESGRASSSVIGASSAIVGASSTVEALVDDDSIRPEFG